MKIVVQTMSPLCAAPHFLAFFVVKKIFSHRFLKGEGRTGTIKAQTARGKENSKRLSRILKEITCKTKQIKKVCINIL
jgi:hypothetical protein